MKAGLGALDVLFSDWRPQSLLGPHPPQSRSARPAGLFAKKFFYWLKQLIAVFDWPRENMKDYGGPLSFRF